MVGAWPVPATGRAGESLGRVAAMKIGPGLVVPALAELVLLALYVTDVLGDAAWPDGFVVPGRVVVVVAAVVIAGICYQAWASVTSQQRTPLVHASAGASLIGGAALASAVTAAEAGRIFGAPALATLGTAALVAAVVCHQLSSARRSLS